MTKYIGIDVGGTKIEGVLVNKQLKVFKRLRIPTQPNKSREKILGNVLKVIKELDNSEVKSIGIGFAGYKGYWGMPNIKKLLGMDVEKELKKKIKKKIVMANDAQCFLLAEHRIGAVKGSKDVLGLTLGTGLGGAAIANGKLVEGVRHAAGHFGHMIIDPSGTKCGCGQTGDVESWCGGKYMEQRYQTLTGKKITAKEMFNSKNKTAIKIVTDMHEKLGVAIANLTKVYNPQHIVLGGSISKEVDYKLLRKFAEKYGLPGLVKDVKITKNKLGPSAGVLGAACLAMN